MGKKRKASELLADSSRTNNEETQAWGRSKKDLELVKITTKQPLKTNVNGLYNYQHISYRNQNLDGEEEESVACRIDYHPATNLGDHTQDVDVSCLETLREDLAYLKYLKSAQTGKWDFAPFTPNVPPSVLSRFLAHGFIYSMTESVGKEAMRLLLQQIISILGLERNLRVMATGSSSHVSFLSTLVEVDSLEENSPESSESPSLFHQTIPTLVVPPDTYGTQSKIVGSSTASSVLAATPTPHTKKRKLTTSDLVVFFEGPENLISSAVTSELVVSVKSGCENSDSCLPIELMSRLPYQSGRIFGLHISACEGQLLSVSRDKENDTVHIFSYTQYSFKRTDHQFDYENFLSLILDLGKVLLSDPC